MTISCFEISLNHIIYMHIYVICIYTDENVGNKFNIKFHFAHLFFLN